VKKEGRSEVGAALRLLRDSRHSPLATRARPRARAGAAFRVGATAPSPKPLTSPWTEALNL